MTTFLDWLQSVAQAPLKWSVADRIGASGVALTIIAGAWAVLIRRSDRKAARLANAPDVAATFTPQSDESSNESAPFSERIGVTLENIGVSPAYDVECSCVAMWDEGMTPAWLTTREVSVPHISSREKVILGGSRSARLDWNPLARRYDDFPFALIEYTISFSDRTHRYTNTYLVAVFGFPDQRSADAENADVLRASRHRSSPLDAGQAAARLRSFWEFFARPIRKRKYRRLLQKREGDPRESV